MAGTRRHRSRFPGAMRQEPDTNTDLDALDEADRACRELSGQIEQARRRLLREYRDILRERSVRENRD